MPLEIVSGKRFSLANLVISKMVEPDNLENFDDLISLEEYPLFSQGDFLDYLCNQQKENYRQSYFSHLEDYNF